MALCRIFRCGENDAFGFLASRSVRTDGGIAQIVAATIGDVQTRGDAALLESARKFDCPTLESILVSEQEIAAARVPEDQLTAIRHAIQRVSRFHRAQLEAVTSGWDAEGSSYSWGIPEANGGSIGQRLRPLASAGIYVPGGKANYPSSVVMNCVPALVAGVKEVAIATPAGADGALSPAVLVAAREIGITKIAKVGGAAAIAAFAFGTESVPRVDKIAGPGNRFVNEAKRQLWGTVGLDLYAGPSEVCVLVGEHAEAEFAVADWLTQVEHAEDNAGFIICPSESKLAEVMAAADRQVAAAPRAATLKAALADFGAAFVSRSLDESVALINAIAPEHLTLAVENAEEVALKVQNAGCILLGELTPESAGDYAIGPSHTLPTSTAARFASPLNVLDFMKLQSVSRLTREDLAGLAQTIETFGQIEGLPAHASGATVRKLG
jgi:histidinol dehydrogenase